MDFILNGNAQGSVANTLLASNFNPGALRPFVGDNGQSFITMNDQTLITNAPATLLKDEWIQLDEAIMRVAKPRLQAFGDLRSGSQSYTIPNGMAKTVLEYQTVGDITPASVSMDGLRKNESDRPEFDLAGLPLPIIHKDFHFSARQIATARNGRAPLDTTMAELAGRRVTEEVEKMTIGTAATYAYAGHSIYGYTNFPSRLTQALTDPTGAWTPADTVAEVLSMKSASQAKFHYGPWKLYTSPDWDVYLDDDYSAAKGDNTLRERLAKIQGIQSVETLDYLTGFDMVLVEMQSDTARAVVGMDLTTVQWESHGGMQVNFKIMAIMVPQLRADSDGNTGIVHGSV